MCIFFCLTSFSIFSFSTVGVVTSKIFSIEFQGSGLDTLGRNLGNKGETELVGNTGLARLELGHGYWDGTGHQGIKG